MIVKFDVYLPDLLQDGRWTCVEQFDLRAFDVHFQQIEWAYSNEIKQIRERNRGNLDNPNDFARPVE